MAFDAFQWFKIKASLPGGKNPPPSGTLYIGGRVETRARLDAVTNRKYTFRVCNRSVTVQPAA